MKVPLKLHCFNDSVRVTYNGKYKIDDLPVRPYFLSDRPNKDLRSVEIEGIRIPDGKKSTLYKYEFDKLRDFYDGKKQLSGEGFKFHSLPYEEQIFICDEGYVLKYPNTDDLKIMYLDIEVLTKGDGVFPSAKKSPVIALGYAVNKGKPEVIDNYDKKYKDKKILQEFIHNFKSIDPDIIVTHNGTDFDIPYILERLAIHGMNMEDLNRHKGIIVSRDNSFNIKGRVHFDTLIPARKDQSLFGLKTRGLKELSRWYGYDAKEFGEDIENTSKYIRSEELKEYLISDIEATRQVSNVYLPNAVTMAETLNVPLDSVVGCFPSFIPKIIIGRHCRENKYYPTDKNIDRYGDVNKDGELQTPGRIHSMGCTYEGAIVGIRRYGVQKNIKKIDFSSMYPSAIRTWNLGVDTVKLLSVEELGEYEFQRKDDCVIISFPDNNYKKNLRVKIDTTKVSFLKKEIEKLSEKRTDMKTLMKEAKSGPEKEGYNSRQMAFKIILNSIYGYMASDHSSYGDTVIGAIITAMCRWTTKKVLKELGDKVTNIDSVTGDTPMWVRSKNTMMLDIIPIQDLHSSEDKRQKYNGEYKVLTRNGWKNINYTKKHEVKKTIHRVKVSQGYVDVTEDHSLFTEDQVNIMPKDISLGDHIEVTDTPVEFTESLSYIDNDFAWILGFLIAEGSVVECEGKRQISFNGNDRQLMLKVKRLADKTIGRLGTKFNLHDTLKSSGVYKVQGGYNKKVCDFLYDLCYCKNRKDKKIPQVILNASDTTIKSFLDGLMIGDGYQRIESLDSKFKCVAAGVRYLWKRLGYKSVCIIRKDKENITTYRKRFPYRSNIYKNIPKNKVHQNRILTDNPVKVYDISTSDGTFVTAMGDIVLHNTDGYIVDKDVNHESINKKIKDNIRSTFGLNSYMILEEEPLLDGYFYKMKNYVVRHKNKKDEIVTEKHGVSLKSSRQCNIYDKVLDDVIKLTLEKRDIDPIKKIEEYKNIKNYKLENLKFRSTFSKELNAYKKKAKKGKPKDENALSLFDDSLDKASGGLCTQIILGIQVEDKLKTKVEENLQVTYYVTKEPAPNDKVRELYKEYGKTSGPFYTLSLYVTSIEQIDEKYYANSLDRIFEMFNWNSSPQLELDLSN